MLHRPIINVSFYSILKVIQGSHGGISIFSINQDQYCFTSFNLGLISRYRNDLLLLQFVLLNKCQHLVAHSVKAASHFDVVCSRATRLFSFHLNMNFSKIIVNYYSNSKNYSSLSYYKLLFYSVLIEL